MTCRTALLLPALAACVLTPLVAACTLGPDFASPFAPRAHSYATATEGKEAAAQARAVGKPPGHTQHLAVGARVEGDWWRLFHSPALDTIVKQALVDNPTIVQARATLSQAIENTTAVAGTALPQVNANAGIARQRVDVLINGVATKSSPVNVFSIGPSVSYALDVFGGIKRQVEAQAAQADVSEYQLAAAYLALTGNIARQALTIADIRAQIRTVNDILGDDRKNLALVQTARQAGTATLVDVTSAETQLANDITLLPPLEQALSVARHALTLYAGKAPGDWTPPDFDLAGLRLPSELPVSLPSALVRQRPDILAAEAQLHVASADIGVATANLYPQINLTADIEQQATHPGRIFTGLYSGWAVGAGLVAPIFHGGTLQAQRRGALDAYDVAFAQYRQTVLESFRQVADVLQALAHDAEAVSAQSHAVDTAAEALRLSRESFAAGNIGILQVLDNERLANQAKLGLVRAQSQRYLDTVQLFVALGSGWWNTPPTEPKTADPKTVGPAATTAAAAKSG